MIGPVAHVNKQSGSDRRGGAPHQSDVPLAPVARASARPAAGATIAGNGGPSLSVDMKIDPGKAMGARIEGVDLAQPVSDEAFKRILRALGEHGVLCFPGQQLETAQFVRFGRMFGELEINVANQFHEPGFPEVMVLSNMVAEGKPVGLGDAGQGWHTDMSYSREIALANVLHAVKVPMRDGVPLGETQFRNMHAAYADLPADIKTRLKGRTATHDFAKFWDMMRARPGSQRAALTAEQRAKKPPVSQPIFRTHPITGRTILYCNPGYATRIDGLPEAESDELLRYLFKHQEQEKYFHAHKWAEGDVLMWDNIGTVHNAVPDYRPDEPRYMRRVQVMATKDYARLAA
jgi:taurine dioxygenase